MRQIIIHTSNEEEKTSRVITGAMIVPLEGASLNINAKTGGLSKSSKYLWYSKESFEMLGTEIEIDHERYVITKAGDYSLLGFYEYTLSHV